MPMVFLVMAGALGVSSFACGMIPLSATYSKRYLDVLNALSTGLLLGTALGVIIPEGIEILVEYYRDSEALSFHIAIDLILGFLLMMTVEHLVAGSSHAHSHGSGLPFTNGTTQLEFDAELGELDSDQSGRSSDHERDSRRNSESSRGQQTTAQVIAAAKRKAVPFTFGLILHGLADGCALGVSAIEEISSESGAHNLSVIVFLALLFHKAPTSVAFAVSLLNTNLPRAECKKYLAIFAASTPVGAIATYFLLSFLGVANNTDLAGSALLISGGTFLYVATVLQPVSHQSETQDLKPKIRLVLVVAGTLTPLILASLIGHGH
ncbi:Zinc/iron permease [Macrolepiota fuliginosa MF-IS2]|uniref:Zinc/iron permease n=1 Tax=Macrolepiota fuliginosa MF-IS2 TaxID=1400762 RepID=A0A9P6C998_9AGAR|nr:Zinc/iron permease [Macrolepiota fuliginosa MF-IS2]